MNHSTLLALAICLVACSGSGEVSTPDDFVAAFADAFCENVQPCCAQAKVGFDLKQCKSNAALGPLLTTMEARMLAVPYDSAAANQCLDALREELRSCSGSGSLGRLKSCGRVYAGDLHAGAGCRSSIQCAPVDGATVECVGGPGGSSERCTVSYGGLGVHEACTLSSDETATKRYCALNQSLFCDPTSSTCEHPPAPGEPCKMGQCGDDAFCDPATDTCMPYPEPGMPCVNPPQAFTPCATGAFCQAGTCQKSGGIAETRCRADEDCAGGYCSAALVCHATGTLAGKANCGVEAVSTN